MITLPPNFELGQDGVLRCLIFSAHSWLDHGFGTKHSQQWEQTNPPVTLKQIHSATVCLADNLHDRQCQGDAIITQRPHKRVGVRTADCVPLLLIDHTTKAVAAVHAGWRGTVAGIVGKTVKQLSESFGSRSSDIHVAIGPSIRECCYEVGRDVAQQFILFDQTFADTLDTSEKIKLDLAKLNRKVLLDAGVNGANVYDSGICTFCHTALFYSYRRDPADTGRLISTIARIR